MVSARSGGRGAGQEGSAQFGLVVQQHDAGAGADGLAGRGQAGGAAADHQDVGVDVLLVVLGAVLLRVQLAQAVEQFSLQAVHQGDGGGGEHGLGHVAREARRDLDQRVGFLHAGGHDAAGAVLVERVAGGDPAVGEQGRGERVAGVAGEFLAVHGETPGDGAVDASAGGEAGVLGSHLVAPSGAVVLAVGGAGGDAGCRDAGRRGPGGGAVSGEAGSAGFGAAGAGRVRPGRAHRVDGLDLVGDRVAEHVEPLAAAGAVQPAFGEGALGVVPVEQELGPFAVVQLVRVFRVGHVGLAAVVELGLVAGAAVGA